ncbi:MAG: efflux RND transporter periplasmic adaptor subunit [Planctomycetes bacterium]|nr:efflux RND transporter periplasmic adaptor subunit [Planctomycetota bacterium]
MNRRLLLSITLPTVAFLPLGACAPASRAKEAEHAEHELEPTHVTVFGQRALLFLEYPHLIQGQQASFLAHLSVLANGEPVRTGRVVLELGALALAAEQPRRDGLFVPAGAPPASGRHAARLVIESDELRETLDLGELVVHASLDEAQHAADEGAAAAGGNEIPFLMEQQWQLRLLVAEAAPRTLVERLILPAQARLAEGAQALVSAPVAGRLVAAAGGELPRSGARVEAGALLARIEAPLDAATLGQLRALDVEFELKALEVVRTLGAAEAHLRNAERERERLAALRTDGLSTQQALDQAEGELIVARVEVEAAVRTKAALDALVARRSGGDGAYAQPLTFPLLAPISGTVVASRSNGSTRVHGESVAPNDEILRIVDASRLWIEGRISEFDLARLGEMPAATVRFTGLGEQRFELASSSWLSFGLEIEEASRTLLVRYAWAPADARVRAGMLAELELEAGRVEAALAIPAEAVVLDQGTATAYVMVSGETFERRELELGLRDGDWVEVRRGLAPGEHVATRGAYQIKLASLSPAAFGAGHQH